MVSEDNRDKSMLSSASGDYGETGSSLLLSLTLLTASLLFTSCAKNPELAMPGETPNVIVIYVDDVGWVDLESYGSEFYETPNIASLLSQGLRFTQAYSNAPLCAPSRIGLLTGCHCARAKCFEVVSGKWDETDFFLRYGQETKDDIIWDWEERSIFFHHPGYRGMTFNPSSKDKAPALTNDPSRSSGAGTGNYLRASRRGKCSSTTCTTTSAKPLTFQKKTPNWWPA